jgi:nucleoside-diphosphate-sugar epimerase
MHLKMKRALVTGHCGLIGRHAAAAFAAAGYEVAGIDIADKARDARDFFRHGTGRFDVVVHAAAVVGGRAMIDGRPLTLAVNLELDAAMFAWAARTRPGRVVYLSSSAVYPVKIQQDSWPKNPLREQDVDLSAPRMPDQLYGWAKLTGERLAGLARGEGVRVSVCRPFSGFSEDQGTDYPFPALAARARRREDPFAIWGTGEQVRDWIHVDDICAAILAIVREGIDGPVNLGTGRPVSMRQLATMMCAAAGYEPEFKPLPEMPAGVAYRVADVTRLSEFYHPEVTLEEGILRALNTDGRE